MRKNARKSRECIICQKEFPIMGKNQKYCSPECSHEGKRNKIEIVCSYCNKTFKVIPSRIQSFENIFCNHDCKAQWQKENLIGKENPNYRGGLQKVECPICGKMKEWKVCVANNGQTRYCSMECKNKGHALNILGENAPSWKGGSLDVNCSNCNKGIKRAKWEVLKTTHFFCSQECRGKFYSISLLGENNPCWRGGTSFKQYPKEFSQIKESIRERDLFSCQLCGMSQEDNKVSLSVHHINYKREECTEDNLISLCSKNGCHPKTNANREYWEQYFQTLMTEKYNYQY